MRIVFGLVVTEKSDTAVQQLVFATSLMTRRIQRQKQSADPTLSGGMPVRKKRRSIVVVLVSQFVKPSTISLSH
jgi:hypothetical protein